MAATAGYKATVQLGPTTFTTVGGLKTAELSVSNDIYDITAMGGSAWKAKLAGLADYTIKIGGNFDLSDAQQTALQAAVLTNPGATITWKIFPTGTGGAAYSGTALVKTEGIKFAVSSEEQVTFDLEGNGALTYA